MPCGVLTDTKNMLYKYRILEDVIMVIVCVSKIGKNNGSIILSLCL